MAGESRLDLSGDKELVKMLKGLGKTPAKRILRKALRDAAKETQQEIKINTPQDTGKLRKLWKVRKLKMKSTFVVGIQIPLPTRGQLGIDAEGGYYPTALEYGWTDKHGNHHPARGFIRNSVNKKFGSNINIIKQRIKDELPKEAEKLAKKKSGKK